MYCADLGESCQISVQLLQSVAIQLRSSPVDVAARRRTIPQVKLRRGIEKASRVRASVIMGLGTSIKHAAEIIPEA